MIVVFISFEAIQIAYTESIDFSSQICIGQKTQGIYEVVKYGVKIKQLFQAMIKLKQSVMIQQQNENKLLNSPIFVCLSAKSRKITSKIFSVLCPEFEKYLLYYRIDKQLYENYPFNRAILENNQICYGVGFSQLRPKQEMKIAFQSVIQNTNCQHIFLQKNTNEIKQLKKQGANYFEEFDIDMFLKLYDKCSFNLPQKHQKCQLQEKTNETIAKYPFAKKYLSKLYEIFKDTAIKNIKPFPFKKLTIQHLIDQIYKSTTYYNISLKSWIPHESSKEISAYIFHNLSDSQIYVSRTSKPKQLSNQQDFQKKILANYLYFIFNPEGFAVPHDKNIVLMKYCKIKTYENKKAFFNVRPYIEGLEVVSQLKPLINLENVLKTGKALNRKVRGLGNILLFSLIINESFKIKSLSDQISLLTYNKMNEQIVLLSRQSLQQNDQDIHVCRTDFYDIFEHSNYKQLNDQFLLENIGQKTTIKLQQLHQSYLNQMYQSLCQINEQKIHFIKSIILYYRWNVKMVHYYQVILLRIQLLKNYLQSPSLLMAKTQSLLEQHPKLSCLLLDEDYSYFMISSDKIYSSGQFDYSQKVPENPFISYINKTCSFAIYNIDFPILSFLQWAKSQNKYPIIEYISMINRSFEDYIIMDKRLKLINTNQKKNVLLIVDHVELCEQILNKPKSVKTVMVLRLKKTSDIQDIGIIQSEIEKKDSFEDSSDEVIRILLREGSKIPGFLSKFQLYDWILTNYIKLKCHLYDLCFQTAIQFLSKLHKAISTNRHRLKQLQQLFPTYYNYLYVFPIIKENQKITLNYKLFEFLHMKYLFNTILSNQWSGSLQTYQNSSIIYWRNIIGSHIIAQITKRLIRQLQNLQYLNIVNSDYKNRCDECLQLIRSLNQPKKQINNQYECQLYYQVFAQQIKIDNYYKIHQIANSNSFLIVQDEENIDIIDKSREISVKMIKPTDDKIVKISLDQNRLYILAINQSSSLINLKSILINQQNGLNFTVIGGQIISDEIIPTLLKDKSNINVNFRIVHGIMWIFIQQINKVVVWSYNFGDSKKNTFKQYHFQQKLIYVQLSQNGNDTNLICLASNKLFKLKLSINQEDIIEQPKLITELNLLLSQKSIVKSQIYQQDRIIFIVQSKNIQYIRLTSELAVIQRQRFTFNEIVKSFFFKNSILFMFFEGSDCLKLYKISQNTLKKVWTYYWVDWNSLQIFINDNNIYIKGGSYIKHIKLRNISKLKQIIQS